MCFHQGQKDLNGIWDVYIDYQHLLTKDSCGYFPTRLHKSYAAACQPWFSTLESDGGPI